MSKKLETMDAQTLMTTPIEPLRFIVSRLILQGRHILAGSPKVGKSWLALWICLQAAKDEAAWGFETRKCEVLYQGPSEGHRSAGRPADVLSGTG